jgi:hypothetical protein
MIKVGVIEDDPGYQLGLKTMIRSRRWQAAFDDLFGLVAGRFTQVQSRRRARCTCWGCYRGGVEKLAESWELIYCLTVAEMVI